MENHRKVSSTRELSKASSGFRENQSQVVNGICVPFILGFTKWRPDFG